MESQITINRSGYVVSAYLPDKKNNYHWEIIDSHRYQYKAIELRNFLHKSHFDNLNQIYRSAFYMSWCN